MEELLEILQSLKPDVKFTKDTRLVDDKIFDSLGMISLVAVLSDEFDVEISPMDIIPENFETVETLYQMIERLADED